MSPQPLFQTSVSSWSQWWQPVLSGRKEQWRPHSKRTFLTHETGSSCCFQRWVPLPTLKPSPRIHLWCSNDAAPGGVPPVTPYDLNHLMLKQLLSPPRNCPSLSPSWFKRLPVAVRMAFFTWVRLVYKYGAVQLSFAVKQSPSELDDLIWTLTKCLPDPFSFTLPVVTDCPLLNLWQWTEEGQVIISETGVCFETARMSPCVIWPQSKPGWRAVTHRCHNQLHSVFGCSFR